MSVEKNLEKQEENKKDILNEERDARCLPIALATLKLLGDWEKHELLSNDKSKTFEAYNGFAQQILQLCLERDLPVGEYNYTHQLVLKALDEVNTIIVESLNKHLKTLQDKTFGCQIYEIKMSDLHSRIGGGTIEE